MTTCPCCRRLMRRHCAHCNAECSCRGEPARQLVAIRTLRGDSIRLTFGGEEIRGHVEGDVLHLTTTRRAECTLHVARIEGKITV